MGAGQSVHVNVVDVGFGFEGGVGLAFGRGGVGVGAVDEPGEAFVLVGVAGDDEVAAPFEGDVEQVGEFVDVSFGGDVPVEHGEDDAVVAVGVAVGKVCGKGRYAGEVMAKVPSGACSTLTVLPSLKASAMVLSRCCRASGAIRQ